MFDFSRIFELGKTWPIWLLNNKFRGLFPSGGFASLSFDQGVPKKLPTSPSERHLMVFCINQIVPGFVVYYLNFKATHGCTEFDVTYLRIYLITYLS